MSDVIFRKIHGHIVPIRKGSVPSKGKSPTPSKSDLVKGIGAASAGVSAALYAGKKAAHFQIESALLHNRAVDIMKSVSHGQRNLFKAQSAQKLVQRSKLLHGARNYALLAGGLVAAPLIAYGAQKLLQPPKKKDQNNVKIAGAFGVGTAIAATEYYRRLIDPSFRGLVPAVKKAFDLAKNRKTIQFVMKGI